MTQFILEKKIQFPYRDVTGFLSTYVQFACYTFYLALLAFYLRPIACARLNKHVIRVYLFRKGQGRLKNRGREGYQYMRYKKKT